MERSLKLAFTLLRAAAPLLASTAPLLLMSSMRRAGSRAFEPALSHRALMCWPQSILVGLVRSVVPLQLTTPATRQDGIDLAQDIGRHAQKKAGVAVCPCSHRAPRSSNFGKLAMAMVILVSLPPVAGMVRMVVCTGTRATTP